MGLLSRAFQSVWCGNVVEARGVIAREAKGLDGREGEEQGEGYGELHDGGRERKH